MAKRIYEQTMFKWALGAGIPSGIAGFTLLFLYLSTLGLIDVTSYSGDSTCAGTIEDPCLAFIEFTAMEDIFIYPTGYDPWGRRTLFFTDEGLESWKIYRSWGSIWREIKLNETCKGTWCGGAGNKNLYSFAFREGREYTIKIEALKKDPTQTIKWGFGPVDPFWYGVPSTIIEIEPTTFLYYDFEQSNGTSVPDVTTRNNDAISVGANITTEGKFLKGWEFFNDGDNLNVTNTFAFSNTSDYTFMGWFNNTGDFNAKRMFHVGEDAVGGFAIYVETNDVVIVSDTSPNNALTSPGTLVANVTWNHLAVTYNGTDSNFTIYVNGTSAATGQINPMDDWSGQVLVGHSRDASDSWVGPVDEIIIYERILAPAEISAVYDNYTENIYGFQVNLTNATELNLELGSNLLIVANITGVERVCIDVDHPNYGEKYACGSPTAQFVFNISWFRNNELNDSSTVKNVSWVGGGNQTVFLRAHQYDELVGFMINVSGFEVNDTFPTGVNIYVNDTLSNSLGLLFTGDIVLDETNNSEAIENLTYTTFSTQTTYLRIPKNAIVSSAFINLSGFITEEVDSYDASSAGAMQVLRKNLMNKSGTRTTITNRHVTNITFRVGKQGSPTLPLNYTIRKVSDDSVIQTGLWDDASALSGVETTVWERGVLFVDPPLINEEVRVILEYEGDTLGSNGVLYSTVNSNPKTNHLLTRFLTSWSDDSTKEMQFRITLERNLVNVSLEVGAPDGVHEWNYTGKFNHTDNRTGDFSSAINTSLSTCTADSDGFCLVPLSLNNQGSGGIIQVSDIAINYTSNPNPVIISSTLVSSFIGNSTDFVDIPIKFESSKNGTLQISDIRFDYAGGNDTIQVLVYDAGSSGHSTLVFNNSLQAENLTFSGNENLTRYLSLPAESDVTSAFLNFTGRAVASAFPTNDLLTYYDFEETSGVLIDRANGNNNGTVNGTTRSQGGIVGNSYHFNGFSDLINVTDDDDLDLGANFTISVWIYHNASNPAYVFSKIVGEAKAYYMFATDTGSTFSTLMSESDDSDVTVVQVGTEVVNTWQHLVMLLNGSDSVIYIDGSEVGKSPYDGTLITHDTDLLIGFRSASTYFNGSIDELGMWNRSLSPSEISDLYNGGAGLEFSVESNITNPYLEIGTVDGTYEWNFTGTFSQTNNRTLDLSSSINTALNSGACDCTGCSLVTNCSIPFQFHSDSEGLLQYDWQILDYNITSNKTNNETFNIVNFYSDWDFLFPSFISWIEFIPRSPVDKNVSVYGQSDSRPILNVTNYGYGGRNSTFSIYLNESFSCVNLTISTTENKSDSFILNDTWTDLFINSSYRESNDLWMWADYSCNFTTWKLWEPDLYFRNCAVDTICSEALT